MATEGGTKAVMAALLANLGIAVTKFVAWALTGASSMLAEAIHSVADSGNQVLLLVGGRRARQKATPEHPFGYGRVRYVFAFIVSIVLFSVGGLFALYEAFHKYEEIRDGHPNELLESSWWWIPIVVLTAAIVMESFSFRTAIRESDKVRGRRSWVQFVRRAKSPELPVILLEDLGALVGLVLALAGVSLSLVTENAYWDVAGTASIGVLLVVIAVILAIEMSSLLIGEGAVQEKADAIARAIAESDGVSRVIHMRTLYTGPEELLVAAKIGVSSTHTGDRIAAAIDDAEARIRVAVPEAVHIYLEPDLDRATAGRQAQPDR
ncbi:cation diffusion facilitator family transporter [Phytoactinopolyspora endophytica]|uniref:cation diffusion facilitator family transporter n=1 Tax=Phytoactinopolyspora endophytica TaxID=1642495 RepID=UPI00101D2266